MRVREGVEDQGEVEEAKEEHVERLEAGEDSAEALEATEQPLDLVAVLVEGSVVVPGLDTIGLGRNHRNHAQVEHELSGLIAFIGSIHQHGQAFGHSREFPKQLPSLGCIMGIARRQSEGYGRSSIRGNHMNLGVPSAPGLADGLWSVFFRAPVPSGCTLIELESKDTASRLIRTIRSTCNCAHSLSRSPLLDHRLIRI